MASKIEESTSESVDSELLIGRLHDQFPTCIDQMNRRWQLYSEKITEESNIQIIKYSIQQLTDLENLYEARLNYLLLNLNAFSKHYKNRCGKRCL